MVSLCPLCFLLFLCVTDAVYVRKGGMSLSANGREAQKQTAATLECDDKGFSKEAVDCCFEQKKVRDTTKGAVLAFAKIGSALLSKVGAGNANLEEKVERGVSFVNAAIDVGDRIDEADAKDCNQKTALGSLHALDDVQGYITIVAEKVEAVGKQVSESIRKIEEVQLQLVQLACLANCLLIYLSVCLIACLIA